LIGSTGVKASSPTTDQTVEVNRFVRAGTLLWLYLKRPFLLARVRRHTIERVNGVPLVVWPEVLNPVVFRSGEFLARAIEHEAFAAPPTWREESFALDMGTGSGICAIFAARRGYRATAIDLNPDAVRCARTNVLLNGLEDEIQVLEGDLFSPVNGRRFDLITFNPPFFRGEPKSRFELAWRSMDVFERFAAGLTQSLLPGGRALIVLSTDGDPGMLAALEQNGLTVEPVLRRNFGNEIMTIYCARLN
jgi:methylase of polypeptide subunit release factors